MFDFNRMSLKHFKKEKEKRITIYYGQITSIFKHFNNSKYQDSS